MRRLLDTSVLIDALRGNPPATAALEQAGRDGEIHASEMTRVEILIGMRPGEEAATRDVFARIAWHEVDERIATLAGELGRRWRPSHGAIGSPDLIIGATAILSDCELFTTNVKRFPMFPGLAAPY